MAKLSELRCCGRRTFAKGFEILTDLPHRSMWSTWLLRTNANRSDLCRCWSVALRRPQLFLGDERRPIPASSLSSCTTSDANRKLIVALHGHISAT